MDSAAPRAATRARVLLRAGDVVAARYRVRRVLAIGGMGVVYQVVDADGAPLAMKTLLPEYASDPSLARRFDREVRAMRKLAHPGVVSVVDTVEEDGVRYLLMPLVIGRTLDQVQGGRPLAPRRALLIARQILDALDHAHGLGVVHRDLKPQNLMVTTEQAPRATVERVRILDFGVARVLRDSGASASLTLTQSGFTQGTPAYMAPEQVRRDGDVDGRADLYALGVILFEMFTGVRPFDGPDDISIMRAHLAVTPPWIADLLPLAPFCTPALESLVATALAKEPERRFRDAAAMRDALDHAFTSIEQRGALD